MQPDRRKDRGRRRRTRVALLALVVLVLLQLPASATLQPAPISQLPLPTSTPLVAGLEVDQPISDTVDQVTGVVNGTTQQIGGLLGETKPDKKASKSPAGPGPRIGSPATLEQPAGGSTPGLQDVRVSGSRVRVPSYGAALTDGFSRTARRAADLAGPVAAPMALAMFAVALLLVAARGPGRLVKVEEERKAFREQRTFRL